MIEGDLNYEHNRAHNLTNGGVVANQKERFFQMKVMEMFVVMF